jgi:hypothetical protein
MKISVTKTSETGRVRLFQTGLSITKDRNYTLSFTFKATPAKPDSALYMYVILRPHEGSYVPTGLAKKVAVASYGSFHTVTLPFTALTSVQNARIQFSLNHMDAGNVMLDDVVLTESRNGSISSSDWKGASHERLDNVIPYIKSAMRLKWYYNWTASNDNDPNSDSILADPAFVPMVWCKRTAAQIQDLERKAAIIPDRPWLVLNEPDNAYECGKHMPTPEDAAGYYNQYYDAIMRGSQNKARIFVGGTMYSPLVTGIGGVGRNWWYRFARAVERPIMGVHIHVYGHNPAESSRHCTISYDPSQIKQAAVCWTNELRDINKFFREDPTVSIKIPVKTADLVWVTETGILTSSDGISHRVVRDNWMKPLVEFWKKRPVGLGRLAWYTDFERPRCYNSADRSFPWSRSAGNLLNVSYPTQTCVAADAGKLATPIINPAPADVSLSPLGAEWAIH